MRASRRGHDHQEGLVGSEHGRGGSLAHKGGLHQFEIAWRRSGQPGVDRLELGIGRADVLPERPIGITTGFHTLAPPEERAQFGSLGVALRGKAGGSRRGNTGTASRRESVWTSVYISVVA